MKKKEFKEYLKNEIVEILSEEESADDIKAKAAAQAELNKDSVVNDCVFSNSLFNSACADAFALISSADSSSDKISIISFLRYSLNSFFFIVRCFRYKYYEKIACLSNSIRSSVLPDRVCKFLIL